MTDHQKAAIEALKDEVYAQLNGHYGDFSTPSNEEVEATLAAAEPHLRRKWAEELLGGGVIGAGYSVLMSPKRGDHPVTTFTRAVKHMLALLEGAGE